MHHVPAVDRADVVLGALLRPLDRASEAPRHGDRDRALAVYLDLRAEATADVRCDHADLRLGDAENELQDETDDVRRLRRRPERDLARGTDLCEHSTRLDRIRDEPRLVVPARDDDVRRVDRGLHVACIELPDVALVRTEVGVHERCVVRERLLDVEDGRERLVLDLHELGRVLRERPGLGDDDGHPVSLIARLVGREWVVRRHLDVLGHRPGARERPLPVLHQVGTGEGRDHPFCRTRLVEVHAHDPRVRIGAPDDGHVDGAREGEVVDERPPASKERRVFLALDGGSDEHGRSLDGGHDATPAAASTARTMLW